ISPPPPSTPFPYTTLFRSSPEEASSNSRLADAAGSRPIVITYVGFRLIEGIIARTPRRLAYAIGIVTSTLAFPLLARQRKALERSEEHTSELQSLAYLVCR